MHHSFFLHNYNLHREEEIITWAENETKKIYDIIKHELQTNNSPEEDKGSEETN